MTVHQQARELAALDRVDYADLFARPTPVAADPERWARAMFGDVPSRGERFIWRGLLAIRLDVSPSTVAGWRIGARGPDWIRLEAESPYMTSNLVVRAPGGQVSLLTVHRFDRVVGRLLWTTLSPVHRHLAPGLLRDAEARLH